jgi:hypothetical protein
MDRKDLMAWSYWAQVDTFYNQPFDIATPEERKRIEASHAASGKELGKYVAALMLTKADGDEAGIPDGAAAQIVAVHRAQGERPAG